ncbi:MAG: PucC family protein, partial [Pseudomonadota bacterium]
GGSLIGFWLASYVLARGASPTRMAWFGALVGVPAFGAIIAAAQGGGVGVFTIAVLFAGFGAGLFGHGTLTATMRNAPPEQVGLALGAWGAVQATCAGIAVAVGGVIRDMILVGGATSAQAPYVPVFALEMAFLIFAVIAIWPLKKRLGQKLSRNSQQEAYVS